MATKKFQKKSSDVVYSPPVKHNWSEYQKAFFADVASGTSNTVVIARAGSAKTSSCVESFKHIPKGKKTLFVAFNKSIADELRAKSPSYVDTSTLHSLGYKGVRASFGNVLVDQYKMVTIVESLVGKEKEEFELRQSLCKCVSLCKNMLVDAPEKIKLLMEQFDIDHFDLPIDKFVEFVIKAMGLSKQQNKIVDFDDMIWFPVVFRISLPKYDYIYIDEAQDLNACQMSMIMATIKQNSRVFVVCDNFQAIYGFRGADSNSIKNLIEKLDAKILKLPITYRCPKKVIEIAKQLVPDIECPSTAIEGEVSSIEERELTSKVKPGDFIISRTNAPLIKNCMKLLKEGIPANIKGRDIGANLSSFVKKSKAKTVAEFREYLFSWLGKETERLINERKSTDIATDKAECLDNLSEDAESIQDIFDRIDKLFKDVDDSKKVMLGSTHRMKGLEGDRVFVLKYTYRHEIDPNFVIPEDGSGGSEENNLFYVAVTRAKKELIFVDSSSTSKYAKYSKYDNKKTQSL